MARRKNRSVTPVERTQAYRDIFGSPQGQIVLADLMQSFSYTRGTTQVVGDPYSSAWREGQRSVMVHIGRRLEDDPTETQEDDNADT